MQEKIQKIQKIKSKRAMRILNFWQSETTTDSP